MVSAYFAPAKHGGKMVEVRGFLIRQPEVSKINVSSLTAVGEGC
jgi:hypothetical protein